MTDRPPLKPETLVARAAGYLCDRTGAVVPPVHPSATYARDDTTYDRIGGRGYSRDDNATYDLVQDILARLEGGAAAKVFASGMAAIATIFQALKPGDHVVAPCDSYFGTPKWLREWAEPWGLRVSYVDMTDLDALAAAEEFGYTDAVILEEEGAILAWGFAPYTGGVLSFIDTVGLSDFVTRADELKDKYGKPFEVPQLLRDMASKGETFYGRFAPEKKAA